jgi:hypothetical protein
MADRTKVSNAAIALSDMYEVHCATLLLQGDVPRRPVLSIPEGPSTEGGKLARQHITLEPDGVPAANVTVGWVDLPTHRASLKTFPCLLEAHRARFGSKPFPLDGVGYEKLLEITMAFLQDQGFTIEMERKPILPEPSSERGGVRLVPALIAGGVVLVLIVWLAFFR